MELLIDIGPLICKQTMRNICVETKEEVRSTKHVLKFFLIYLERVLSMPEASLNNNQDDEILSLASSSGVIRRRKKTPRLQSEHNQELSQEENISQTRK
jgi:hypothetical protein